MSKNKYKDGYPCKHPGCLSHKTHPCEKCGRIQGYPVSALDTRIHPDQCGCGKHKAMNIPEGHETDYWKGY